MLKLLIITGHTGSQSGSGVPGWFWNVLQAGQSLLPLARGQIRGKPWNHWTKVSSVVAIEFSLNIKINLAIKCYLQWGLNTGPLVSKFMQWRVWWVEPRQPPMEALTKCSRSVMRGAFTLSLRERKNDCSKQWIQENLVNFICDGNMSK